MRTSPPYCATSFALEPLLDELHVSRLILQQEDPERRRHGDLFALPGGG